MSESEPAPKKRFFTFKRVLILIGLVLLPILILAAYTGVALSWSYSQGERAGVLQKFSRRGWVCKTWEGELAMTTNPGTAPVIWHFTVGDDKVATEVNKGLGRPVVLHYDEHRGLPSACFGDTEFFVRALDIQGAP